jgi:hypothetical protein
MRPATTTTKGERRMTGLEIAVLTLVAIAGITGGFLAWRQLGETRRNHDAAVVKRSEILERLRSENVKLQQREQELVSARPAAVPNQDAASPVGSAAESRTARIAALLSLAKVLGREEAGFLIRQRMAQSSRQSLLSARAQSGRTLGNLPELPASFVGPDAQLQPRFGELFGIGAEEVARLQHVLNATRDRVDELVAANTTLRDPGNGSYILEVNAVADEQIAADRDRMIATFKEVLGEDGYRAFALLNGESESAERPTGPNAFFDSFGNVGRTATISKAGGQYRYEMTFGPNGRASGGGRTLESIRERVGAGIKLLPPGF